MKLMSINYYGKCSNCGKNNQRVTFEVHIHDIPGTRAHGDWWLDCVRGIENKEVHGLKHQSGPILR